MVNGFIEGYHLEDQDVSFLMDLSSPRDALLTQPVVSDGSIAWTTDKGFFYVADSDPPKVRLRIETEAEITSRPAHWAPYMYACSLSGFVYALNEETGQTVWKFPAGSSISKQPAAINGVRSLSFADAGGMWSKHVNGRNRLPVRWFAPNISQLLLRAKPLRHDLRR